MSDCIFGMFIVAVRQAANTRTSLGCLACRVMWLFDPELEHEFPARRPYLMGDQRDPAGVGHPGLVHDHHRAAIEGTKGAVQETVDGRDVAQSGAAGELWWGGESARGERYACDCVNTSHAWRVGFISLVASIGKV